MSEYKSCAQIEDGVVVNISVWSGDLDEWQPPEGQIAILLPEGSPVQIGWLYDGSEFHAPPEPPLTQEQIVARNTNDQMSLLYYAAQSMAPVLVSLQLGDATDAETEIAKKWQKYYRDLKAIDLTLASPEWPKNPAVA